MNYQLKQIACQYNLTDLMGNPASLQHDTKNQNLIGFLFLLYYQYRKYQTKIDITIHNIDVKKKSEEIFKKLKFA